MREIVLGKRKAAIGLTWYSLESTRGALKEARAKVRQINAAQARRAAQREDDAPRGYTHVFIRSGTHAQLAAGQADEGAKVKGIALAALVADAAIDEGEAGETFVGRYPLAGGVWIVIARDGAVLPGGDRFFEDAHKADKAFEEASAREGVKSVSFETEPEAIEALEGIVAGSRVKTRAYELNPKPPYVLIGIVSGVVVVLVLGIVWHVHEKSVEQAAAQKAAQAAARRAAKIAAEKAKSAPPAWSKKPLPSAAFGACRKGFERAPLVDRGWELTTFICMGGHYILDWRWADGAGFEHRPMPSSFDPKHPAQTKTVLRARTAPPRAHFKKALDLGRATAMLYDAARILGASGVKVKRPRGLSEAKAQASKKPIDWVWKFTYTGGAPWEAGAIFDRIPGLVIKTISYSVQNDGQWSLTGELYAYPNS